MTIADIIIGCKKGDPACQKLLVERYAPFLMSVSRRYIPSNMDPEDNLQDSMIKILRWIDRFDPERGSLEAWMKRIVINTALDKLKKKSSARNLPLEDVKHVGIEPESYMDLDGDNVLKLIETLPDGYKQIFNLYVIEGFSHKEIANTLQIGESSSRSSLARAKEILRKKLEQFKSKEAWLRFL